MKPNHNESLKSDDPMYEPQRQEDSDELLLIDPREDTLELPMDETFEKVKEQIRVMLTANENGDEKSYKRSGSTVDSKEIQKILNSMKEPKYGITLPEMIKVDSVQKFYSADVLIMGVNSKRICVYSYETDRQGIPISYNLVDTMHFDMEKGYFYQWRSKLEDGFIYSSSEEIITIRFNPETQLLERNLLLLLSDVKDMLDDQETDEKNENSTYSRINDETLRFSEARYYQVEDSEEWNLCFSVHSDYFLDKQGQVVKQPSSMAMIYRVNSDSSTQILKTMQTKGYIENLTLASNKANVNKIYYFIKNKIFENYMKSFVLKSSTSEGEIKVDSFNYEKLIYKATLPITQFEIDIKKKYIFALSEGKVKKLNKYDKKTIPSYFEQEKVVVDFQITGKYVLTVDKNTTLTIWDTEESKILNNLPFQVEDESILTTLDGLEYEEGDKTTDEDPSHRLIDILINDDYSELIIILKGKLLFWQIPMIEIKRKLGLNISTNSSICFQQDAKHAILNCNNTSLMTLRQDSLKIIARQELPENVLICRLSSLGEACIVHHKVSKDALKNAMMTLLNTKKSTKQDMVVNRIKIGIDKTSEEIFRTKQIVTDLEFAYKQLMVDPSKDTPEFTCLLLINEQDMVLISSLKSGGYLTKNLSRTEITDPQFMRSARDIQITSKIIKDLQITSSKDNNINFSDDEQSLRPPRKNTKNAFDLEDADLMSTKNGGQAPPHYKRFKYIREICYFVGYLEQMNDLEETVIHFVAFNPYKTTNQKIILENVFVEKKNILNKDKHRYRISFLESKKNQFLFVFNSSAGLFIVNFNISNYKCKKIGEIHTESSGRSSAQLASSTKHLYVPVKNRLEIYDLDKMTKVYTIETEGNILEVFKGRGGVFIGAVDINYFYLIDVQTMLIVRKNMLTNLTEQTKMMIIDMNFYDQLKEYQLPEFNQDVTMMHKIDYSKISGLRYMPIDHLVNCFKLVENEKSIVAFADFYKTSVDMTGGYDYIFGPLNPFTFAIFYSEENILQFLLENYTYPKFVRGFLTPIEYCMQNEEHDCLRILCSLLISNNRELHLTRKEFVALLGKNFEFCHQLLAIAPRKIPFDKINFSENINKDTEIRFSSSFFDFMRENEIKQLENEKEEVEEEDDDDRQRIDILYAPFEYDFSIGSMESLNFLDKYTTTKSDDFVLSDWRHLISMKWSSLKYFYAFNGLIYYIYMFFCTYSIVFNLDIAFDGTVKGEKLPAIRYCAQGFNIIVTFLEVLQMIAYCTFKPVKYFVDFWNYIDLFSMALAFVFFAKLHEQATEGSSIFIALILMLLIYYRGFSYLRFFDSFTSMIGMINTIVGKSISFFGALFYAYFVVFFMLIRVDPSDSVVNKIRDAYIFALFGGVEQDHFDARFIFFPIVIGTMIVTIILLNVLIAFMSNVYNRMEKRQAITSLKEKASMLLDLEVYISLFLKIYEKCKGVYKKEEYMKANRKVTFFLKKIEGVVSKMPDNIHIKIQKLEKDIIRFRKLIKTMKSKGEREFTSIKKTIKGINKFFGYEQNEVSHFDAKMQGIMIALFEEFGRSITEKMVDACEEEFGLKRKIKNQRANV